MSTFAIVVRDRHYDEREPTAADLVAYLQARPDLAVEVVGGLRVAGPWDHDGAYSERRAMVAAYHDEYADGSEIVPATIEAVAFGDDEPEFYAEVGGKELDGPDNDGAFPTRDAAMAAVDAALTATGWALAGGAR